VYVRLDQIVHHPKLIYHKQDHSQEVRQERIAQVQ
jgi:hypothetical protein